jgi:hypothetical protein
MPWCWQAIGVEQDSKGAIKVGGCSDHVLNARQLDIFLTNSLPSDARNGWHDYAQCNIAGVANCSR